MHTGFKSTKHLWYNRGFTSALGSLLTGGDYYNANPSAGVRWQNDHPLFSAAHFNNPPPDCTAQTKEPGNGTCVNEYSTALWGQAAIQAAADHKLPAPLYIHLCFQAVHEPYDPPPGLSKTVRQWCFLDLLSRMPFRLAHPGSLTVAGSGLPRHAVGRGCVPGRADRPAQEAADVGESRRDLCAPCCPWLAVLVRRLLSR